MFATADGGQHWKNVSGNLPDVPVNSIVLDPSYPNTLYAAIMREVNAKGKDARFKKAAPGKFAGKA